MKIRTLVSLVLCSILLFISCGIVTLLEHADVNSTYPTLDCGIGVGNTVLRFENHGGFARLGWFATADFNPDFSRPDWVSLGGFVSREIQSNVTIGFTVGKRFLYIEGTQYGFFIGVDLWPFKR